MNLKEKKNNENKTKQTTRIGTESEKWRSHGGLSVGRESGENRGKSTGNMKYN